MVYRNKVFVSFDGDQDIRYYRLMLAWKQSDHTSFNFNNAHELQQSRDSSLETSIKASLRYRLQNSKVFLLIVGRNTKYLYKFVRWEIEQALNLRMPIIAANINGIRHLDVENCPPLLRDSLSIHVSFNSKIIEHALSNWPSQFDMLLREGKSEPYYYNSSIYMRLGL
jgi:hypothetical protein